MKLILTILILSIHASKMKAAEYATSGYFENKVLGHTESSVENFGNQSLFQFEQREKFSNNLIGLNQIRLEAISTDQDIHKKTEILPKNTFDSYLGENYLRYQTNHFVIQSGYQEIAWGESFGFNYADVINPKNNHFTFYDDLGKTRIPILLINSKIFWTDGSLQLIYSPLPQFSKTLPIDLFIGDYIPQSTIKTNRQNNPKIFTQNEYGLKLSSSVEGFDLSVFYFDHLDRNPYYTIQAATLTEMNLNENHERLQSTGFSLAKTAYDFVLRSDLIYSKNRAFNTFNNSMLDYYLSNVTETLLGLDTPSYEKFTAFFIYAHKSQTNYQTATITPKDEDHAIIKISKAFESEKKLEFVYTHEFRYGGKSIQTLFSWPITNNTELKFGSEFYFGNEASNLTKFKKLNNVFFSLKNYFQI